MANTVSTKLTLDYKFADADGNTLNVSVPEPTATLDGDDFYQAGLDIMESGALKASANTLSKIISIVKKEVETTDYDLEALAND